MASDCSDLEALVGAVFSGAVAELLDRHPEGVSEYALLGLLREVGEFDFLDAPPGDTQALFRAHFLLFHTLYRLRDEAREARRADLEIGPLSIRWLPYRAGEQALGTPDPLRAYYLDPANLHGTSAEDVDGLIASFWVRLQRQDQRAGALAELGLADPVDDETIKRTYRRLAMEHHPDRGGDKARLQALNGAVSALLKKG